MTQQTSSETLEDIVHRLSGNFMFDANLAKIKEYLSDPAILDHIPAVKALREEKERLQAIISEHSMNAGLEIVAEFRRRIAALESQLAELRQGGEAVGWQAQHRNGGKWSNMGIIQPTEDAALAALRESKAMEKRAIQLYTRPQPAIPPGYVAVPVEPDKAALIGEFSFPIEHVCDQCPVDGDCEVCDGSGLYLEQKVVPWTTIKEIIAAHIASAPAIQPAIPSGYVVVKSELFEAVAALVRFAGDWNQGTHAKLYRPVICRLVGEHIASAPAIQPAPDVEHVEDICEAYESGYGHGLKRDGLDGSRTPFADPMQQAAYQYGYECGAEKTGKQAAAPSVPVAEKALPENVKLLLLKAHRQLETEYRQQTRATEAKRVANATCGESPGGASSIALLAESGYISSIGKRNQEVRDEIFAMLAAPADSKEGE